MRPLLRGACHLLGCAIEPVRDPAALSIEASDLQADPGHRGLLVLSATIRNRAPYAIALPYLELTLTDASDQVVVRRAFAPADYVGRASDPAAGIPGNGENVVKLFLDASATAQAGYRFTCSILDPHGDPACRLRAPPGFARLLPSLHRKRAAAIVVAPAWCVGAHRLGAVLTFLSIKQWVAFNSYGMEMATAGAPGSGP